ncbi:hypothetical protein [Rhodopila sp.]|uniref:hypothetical protein n=1 Tax=Rhodopila sp. TaxID=2480087 RepID=UPI003D0C5B5D
MDPSMMVNFDDTRENWRRWGQLVELWICGLQPLPTEVKDLVDQAEKHCISGASVPGNQNRNVKIYFYDQTKELAFMLPTESMLNAARAQVKPGPYPLPVFYDDAYTGQRAVLTPDEDIEFANCRVGEYTINNCM